MTGDPCSIERKADATIGERVLTAARGWLGTPYRHQASARGVGCDCLGLIRGIWRELYGDEPEVPPPYSPDWAERSGEDRLRAAAERALGPGHPPEHAQPGDLLLFAWRTGMPAKHAGILTAPGRFIHAYEQAAVVESALVPSWRRRIVRAYSFPDR